MTTLLAAPTTRSAANGLGGPLGVGTYRAYIYDRGGERRIGEITPIAKISWGRTRDDISSANLTSAGFGTDCCDMFAELRCMRHELVLFRNEVRVWEGPLTRISYQADSVELEARDVMQYVYGRVLVEGYNDAYRPSLTHGNTVVYRAYTIARNALLRDDPNVAAYLYKFDRADDARQSRVVLPYQKTAFEEIDDMAANAGLDYVTVGRRIMFWDTHNMIGRTPVLGDSDFLADPIITEYGMSLSTFSVVADGLGHFGVAGGEDPYYGLVETLASSYTSKSPPAEATALADLAKAQSKARAAYDKATNTYNRYPGLTPAQDNELAAWVRERNTPGVSPDRQKVLDALIKPRQDQKNKKAAYLTQMNRARTDWEAAKKANEKAEEQLEDYLAGLRSQAVRNRMGRDPAPLVVRVPDNSALNPAIMLGINDLIPGVWIPLRSTSTCRKLTQWQKLDSVSVSVDAQGGEKVAVVMSVAPNGGLDPSDLPDA